VLLNGITRKVRNSIESFQKSNLAICEDILPTQETQSPTPFSDSVVLNGARLMHHIIEKGFQAGSLIGAAVVVPLAARKYSKAHAGSLAGAGPLLMRAMASSALWGTAISSLIGGARVVQLSNSLTPEEFSDGMQDRAYRLHYNRGQQRVDLFSEAGMAVGGTAALVLVSPAAAVVLGGAAAGAAAGVLAHIATYSQKKEEE
jgi:Protein of unknown function (DUF1757)